MTTISNSSRKTAGWKALPRKYRIMLVLLVLTGGLSFFTIGKVVEIYTLSLQSAIGITANPHGAFYLLGEDNCVRHFDPNYNFQGVWKGRNCASNSSSTDRLGKLVADRQGNFYAINLTSKATKPLVIEKLDSNGNLVLSWGSLGSGEGQFSDPFKLNIAVDQEGLVYVLDSGNYRVQKFEGNGRFVAQWGSQGSGEGQFSQPNEIKIDRQGIVYILDQANYIQKFDGNGYFLAKINLKQAYAHLAVDGAGNLYLLEASGKRLRKLDSNGQDLTNWEVTTTLPYTQYTALSSDEQGRVYLLFFYSDVRLSSEVQIYDNQGTLLKKIANSALSILLWVLFGFVAGGMFALVLLIFLTMQLERENKWLR